MKTKATDILKFIKDSPHCSIVQLVREFGNDIDGDYMWVDKKKPTLVFWSGLSKDFIELMGGLIDGESIDCYGHFGWSGMLIYMADGSMPQLPVAKQFRKYIEPHWLPITFLIPES